MAGFRLSRRPSLVQEILRAGTTGVQTFMDVQERQAQRERQEEGDAKRDEERQLRIAGILADLYQVPGISIDEGQGPAGELDPEMMRPPSTLRGTAAAALAPAPEGIAEAARSAASPMRGAMDELAPPRGQPAGGLAGPTGEAVSGEQGGAGTSLVDLAEIALGDRNLRIRYDPEAQKRAAKAAAEKEKRAEEERQQAAFDALQKLRPDDYGDRVPGYDYMTDMEQVLEDMRTFDGQLRILREKERLNDEEEQRKQELEQAKAQAETELAILIGEGNLTITQALSLAQRDPLTTAIGTKRIREIYNEVTRTGGRKEEDDAYNERRQAWVTKLGKPKTALEQDIVDSLAAGLSEQEILATFSEADRAEAESYLAGLAK